jgi:hypothetical protein
MQVEAILLVLALIFGMLPWISAWRRRQPQPRGMGTVVAWGAVPVILAWAAVAFRQPIASPPAVTDMPIAVQEDGYVSSQTCLACHPHEHSTWYASYHRTMTQLASPQTVLGEFDDVHLELDGKDYFLTRDGDRYLVDMDFPEWPYPAPPPRVQCELTMTTGTHHMQIYWYPSGQTRMAGMLPFVYYNEEQRWIPRRAAFMEAPDSPREIPFGRWNDTCLNCHTTHPKPRIYPDEVANMDTHVAEFGIACESCHGPGSEHVRANRDPQRRYRLHLSGGADPTIVNPVRLSHRLSSQVCGQCHGVKTFYNQSDYLAWRMNGSRYRPGDDLDETRNVICNANLDRAATKRILEHNPNFHGTHFWPDGMIRVSGREYNGLVETPCFQRGEMSCLTCHTMHLPNDDPRPVKQWANDQLKLTAEDSRICLSCHQQFAGHAPLTAHTHHAAGSSGSDCYNCHMPHTTYGLLKAIRSHQVDNPSVAVTLTTGRPNACNLCHLDRPLGWTAAHLADWYGQRQPELTADQRDVAAGALWALQGDAGQRALTAWSMGWEPAQQTSGTWWMAPYLGQLLDDPYAAVRYVAYRSIRRLPGYTTFRYDFVGPAEHQTDARRRAFALWRGLDGGNKRAARRELLIGRGHILQQESFDRLLSQRDNREVYLAE